MRVWRQLAKLPVAGSIPVRCFGLKCCFNLGKYKYACIAKWNGNGPLTRIPQVRTLLHALWSRSQVVTTPAFQAGSVGFNSHRDHLADWFNGRTTGSDPVDIGSIPLPAVFDDIFRDIAYLAAHGTLTSDETVRICLSLCYSL